MLRALFSGYATEQNGDTITVMGPNKNAIALRRTIAFVPEFDPAAPVRKVTLAVSDALAAGRNAGLTSDEVLQSDPTDMGALVVVTPTDPAAAGELVFQNPRGLLAVIHSNERIRIGWHTPQNDATVVSGVMTGADETALLEVETSGVGHVYKLLPNGTQDLFDVNPTLTFDAAFSPANPDSLAIGPHGELAVLRLASGSDPPSDLDPSLLIRQAMPAAPPTSAVPSTALGPIRYPGRAAVAVCEPCTDKCRLG